MLGSRSVAKVGRVLSTRAFSVPGTFLSAEHVSERVLSVLKSMKCVPPTVVANQPLSDLGFDSLLKKDFWTKLEDEFCVEIAEKDAAGFKSATDASAFISKHPKAR